MRRDWDNPEEMISVDDALERIIARFSALEPEWLPLQAALGRVLAEDIAADAAIPPFRNSAMDGYAVRSADTVGAGRGEPVVLEVTGLVAAGYPGAQGVSQGQAARIMTGAPLPPGADAVVRFEETDEAERRARGDGGHIGVPRPVGAGENVREAGEDLARGEVAIPAGAVIRPAEVAVLAALNHPSVAVHRRPRVAILSTGDEVVPAGEELGPGKIRDTNGPMLAALVTRCGGEASLLGIARDATDELRYRLRSADRPDLYITSGGVSVGDYDMVKDVLRAEGDVDIWQVRMKPGKPLAFGRIGATPLLGLPGNPAAAMVAFEQFGRPAILKMLGHRDLRMPTVKARLLEPIENRGRRRHFMRAWLTQTVEGYAVRPAGKHGSAMLSAMVRANCLAVIPEDVDSLDAGAVVTVQLIDGITAPGTPASDGNGC